MYDRAHERWLPAPRELVTPDGLRYVFATLDYQGVVVVEEDGSSRVLELPAPTGMGILRAQPEGVYVALFPGLVLLGWDGSLQWLTHDGYWYEFSNGSAYGTMEQDHGFPNSIARLDVGSGAVTAYFARPGMISSIVGLAASGAPVLKVYNSTTYEVWLAGPSPVRLAGGKVGQFWVNSVFGDDHGIWIGTRTGLYLYTAAHGFEFASPVTGYLTSSCA